jgi:hypothetical protein
MPITVPKSDIVDPNRFTTRARLTPDAFPVTWWETVKPPGHHDMMKECAYFCKFVAKGFNWVAYAHFENGKLKLDRLEKKL